MELHGGLGVKAPDPIWIGRDGGRQAAGEAQQHQVKLASGREQIMLGKGQANVSYLVY